MPALAKRIEIGEEDRAELERIVRSSTEEDGTPVDTAASIWALEPPCPGLSTQALKCPRNRGKSIPQRRPRNGGAFGPSLGIGSLRKSPVAAARAVRRAG